MILLAGNEREKLGAKKPHLKWGITSLSKTWRECAKANITFFELLFWV